MEIKKPSIRTQSWNASCRLSNAVIVTINHKIAVKPTHTCTSSSLRFHTEGLFFTLVLLLLNPSHRIYWRWITLHSHCEKNDCSWWNLIFNLMSGFGISLNVFVLKTFTDQCEICSLLQVVVCSQRHFQGWWAGGGQSLRVCVFFLCHVVWPLRPLRAQCDGRRSLP